jgi:hypothetical protein
MSSTSFERANIVAGQSKITSEKILLGKNHKYFHTLHYIEIPDLVARKFDLRDGDSLVWRYYHDKRVAIVTKREGWKSRSKINHEKPVST